MGAKVGITGNGQGVVQAYDELLKKADMVGEDLVKDNKT